MPSILALAGAGIAGTLGALQAAPDTLEGMGARKVTAVEHAYASWSPDGERLVLQSNRAGSWDLYLMDADGSGLVRLTHGPSNETTPTWSPDGSRIAYQSDASGDLEIHVLTLEDGLEHRVTHSPGYDGHPFWTADGRTLVISSERSEGDWDIREISLAGDEVRSLTTGPELDSYGSLSPDGSRLVFRRIYEDDEGTADSEVAVLDLDTGELTRIAPHPDFDGWPTWSPDGERVVFASNRDGSFDVWTARVDGSEVRRVAGWDDSDDARPYWSPDGTRIVFNRARSGTIDVWISTLPGGT